MQLIRHETSSSERFLAETIKALIDAGHCIERVDRRSIKAHLHGGDKRDVAVYEIESVTVADPLEPPQ